ncbi:hypothetical protein LINGRAHAP2_LOCUS19610 [Linum grandiflorum]
MRLEGTQLFNLGGFFRIKSVCVGEARENWIERRCLCFFFIDRIPITFCLRRRDKGEAPNRTCSILNLHPSLVISGDMW